MFLCYICGTRKHSLLTFRNHINHHSLEFELIRPIRCCQNSCKSTFSQTFNYFRHLERFHKSDEECENVAIHGDTISGLSRDDVSTDNTLNRSEVTNPNDVAMVEGSLGDQLLQNIKREGISLIASLRANSSIPFSVIPQIVQSVNKMCANLTQACHYESMQSFVSSGNSPAPSIEALSSTLSTKLEKYDSPLTSFESTFKQNAFFLKHEYFVGPESVNFGLRFESIRGQTKSVYDTFQYVPVEKTIKCLMTNESYLNMFVNATNRTAAPGVIEHFSDGELAASSLNFSYIDTDKMHVQIQLFYDGMGTTNPLRGQSVLCNMGVFYYVIKNLPDAVNSCFANVHLLALCYEHDLKAHGFSPVLDKFCSEMTKLSTSGFDIMLPGLGCRKIYVNLCQVTCDNLALNGLLGFVESFSGDYFCTLCYTTNEAMQAGFTEECFELRNRQQYVKDVGNLRQSAGCHEKGVKRDCELNNIPGYHVTENFSNDIMHTILEGVVPLTVGCVLYSLVCEKKLFTLAELNKWILQLFGLINVDKQKRPPCLNRLQPPGSGLSPSMKASQCWGLIKYLPLIIGIRVAAGDEHYKLLLQLSELVDISFSPRFSCGMIAYTKEVIKNYLMMFKQLYGDRVSIKPKQHFLVHFPTILKKSGPLIGMSCLKYELKNSFFKRSAHVVCNFKNICKTLAFRHQQYALYSALSNLHIRDCVVVSKTISMPVESVLRGTVAALLHAENLVESTGAVTTAMVIKRDSIVYRVGHHFVVAVDDDEPTIGVVEHFVCNPTGQLWYMLMRMYETVGFIEHMFSYMVRFPRVTEYRLIKFSELIDHHPVCCIEKSHAGKRAKFVRLPYHLS